MTLSKAGNSLRNELQGGILMKQFGYKNWIVAAIAFSCLCSGCSKPIETGDAKKQIKSDLDNTSIWIDENDVSDTSLNKSSENQDAALEIDVEDILASSESEKEKEESQDPSNSPVTSPISLGTANISNGGFATGDSQYSYYVVHPDKSTLSIRKEHRPTGQTEMIYTSPESANPLLDCLNLAGNALFFRQRVPNSDEYTIEKITVSGEDQKTVLQGHISNVTAYGNYLFYSKDGDILRSDLNGENEIELYVSDESSMDANPAFCIANDRIYFADPTDFAKGGMFFGRLISMDLNGGAFFDMGTPVTVCNKELFFSDGEFLYFYGNTEEGGAAYYRCNLDGTGLELVGKACPCSRNHVDGNDIIADTYELYRQNGPDGFTLIYSGFMDMGKTCIVGDEIYFMETDATKYESGTVTKRINMNSPKEDILD